MKETVIPAVILSIDSGFSVTMGASTDGEIRTCRVSTRNITLREGVGESEVQAGHLLFSEKFVKMANPTYMYNVYSWLDI